MSRTYKKIPRKPWQPKPPEPLIKSWNWQDGKSLTAEIKANNQEYKECRKIEAKYKKKLGQYWNPRNTQEAEEICRKICIRLGVYRKPKVYHYLGIFSTVRGFCAGREIVIQDREIHLSTLLHELAHYIIYRERLSAKSLQSKAHEGDYLWVLELVYKVFLGE